MVRFHWADTIFLASVPFLFDWPSRLWPPLSPRRFPSPCSSRALRSRRRRHRHHRPCRGLAGVLLLPFSFRRQVRSSLPSFPLSDFGCCLLCLLASRPWFPASPPAVSFFVQMPAFWHAPSRPHASGPPRCPPPAFRRLFVHVRVSCYSPVPGAPPPPVVFPLRLCWPCASLFPRLVSLLLCVPIFPSAFLPFAVVMRLQTRLKFAGCVRAVQHGRASSASSS